jgi:signal peptidase
VTTGTRRGALWLPFAALAIAVLLPLAVLLGTAWLFGWKFQPVLTGSMAPTMPPGSLAVVQPADPSRIAVGTMIVFEDPLERGRQVAHRVIQVVPGSPLRYSTKGDANVRPDPMPVPITSVSGVVGWTIPGLGTIISTMAGVPAILLLVVLPLTVLVATEARDLYRRRAIPPVA